jgi:hypothetical protein
MSEALSPIESAPVDLVLDPQPPPGVFYKIDSRRVALREYWWGSPSPVFLIALFIKLFRIPIPSSSDDLCVDSLEPFEIPHLPVEVQTKIEPRLRELAELGFQLPVYHSIDDVLHNTRTNLVTLRHSTGQALARIHNRIWSIRTPPKDIVFIEFITPLIGGNFVWSLSSKADFAAPKSCRIVRKTRATAAELWALHTAAVRQEAKPIIPIADPNGIRRVSEQLHDQVRDFHLARGVFRPLTDDDMARISRTFQKRQTYSAGGMGNYGPILNVLDRLQTKNANWGMTGSVENR